MISCRLVVIMILTGAALSTAVLASLLFGPRLTRLWRQATPLGRFAFAALNVTVGELPPCDYADTECSTNFQVAVDFATMSRFEFSLALNASPSNAVEVA